MPIYSPTGFLDITNATLRTSNTECQNLKIGTGDLYVTSEISPSYELNLSNVTSLGATSPHTLTLSNVTTAIDATSNIITSGNLKIGGLIYTKDWGIRAASGSNDLYVGRFTVHGITEVLITDQGASLGSASKYTITRNVNSTPLVNGIDSSSTINYEWYFKSHDSTTYDLWVRPSATVQTNIKVTSSTYIELESEPSSSGAIVCVNGLINMSGNVVASQNLTVNGNVGIGTTSPSHGRMQIQCSSQTPSGGLTIRGGDFNAGLGAMWVEGSGAGQRFNIQAYKNEGTDPPSGVNPSVLDADAFELCLNPKGGNVGIGTTTPLAKIDARINDGVSSSNWISGCFGPATGSVSRVVVGSYNSSPVIGGHNSTLTAWDKLVINPTNQGYVGVGTFTPLRKLHVEPGMMVANNTTTSAMFVDNSAQSTAADQYSYILNAPRPGTNSGGAVHFINSSQRTVDGGVNSYNIRNDSGDLILGSNTTGLTSINGTTVNRSAGNSSTMIFGPNTSFSSSLVVGATGGGGFDADEAGVVTTNGNLHLDAGSTRSAYLNFYSGSGTIFGNGASGGVSAINASGHVGITTTVPNVRLDFGSPLNNRMINLYGSGGDGDSTGFYGFGINSSTLRYNVSAVGEVHKFYGNTTEFGYINDATGFVSTFTGQHKSFPHETLSGKSVDELSGLIVCASGEHISVNDSIPQRGKDGITVSEAVPIVCLSSYMNEKTVFGVVSNVEDPEDTQRNDRNGAFTSTFKKIVGDTRIYVNSLGEGAVWVCNTNGSLVNGDYITTSNVAGYGQKQDSDTLKNYTVAKITMDCDFRGTLVPKKQIKKKFVTETLQETVEEEYEDNMAEDVYTYDVDGEYYVKTVKDNITTKTRPVMQDYELRDSDGNVITETISKTISAKEYEILVNKEGCVANISGYQNEDGRITVEEYSTLKDRTGYSEIIDNYTQTINQPETYSGKKIIVKTVTHEVDDLDEHGNLQWEDHPTETETAYKIRYLDADGNITDEANHVYKAAFVGCTYHCG